MDLEFIARNVELSERDRTLARKKFGRLSKYFNAVQESRLTVSQEKHRVAVEAFIHGKDFGVAAKAETADWSSSLQEVVAKLEEQARRHKQKLTRPKRPRGGRETTWAVSVVERESVRKGEPKVVETRHVPVVPMTVDEAALQLEGSGDDFIVFREATTDRINVLYRRRDQTYGLVTPDF